MPQGNPEFSILKLLRPYRWLIFFSAFTTVLFSSLALTLPIMLKIAIDKIIPNADYGLFFLLCLIMLLIYGARTVLRFVTGYLGTYTVTRVLVDVRQRVFKHLQSLSLRFYEEYRTGKLISNVISDVGLLQGLVGLCISLSDQLFSIFIVLIMLFWLNWKLALIIMCILPLHYLNFMYFRKVLQKQAQSLQEKMSEISANLSETINGIKVVKSFSKERSECRHFFNSLRPTMDLSIRLNIQSNCCWSICDTLSLITYLICIGFGIMYVRNKEMMLGDFVAFYTYLGLLLAPINALAGSATIISQGLAGARRIVNLLSVIPEIREGKDGVKAQAFTGDIEFDDVSFKYVDTPVVKHFSLHIHPGEKVALVGPSGCGKSTLSNLLLRFYDVTEGQIRVDGVDIRRYTQESYRKNVGVVLQEPFLFSGTIRDNIAYSRANATLQEVKEAAKLANVAEFVDKLEHGYDTIVGENGASLSGGQKQRLAIARAILRNPSILILDEATSALDTVSEKLVQEALDKLMEGRTTIIIAHRLSTIRNADKIVVLRQGVVMQTGTHDELLAEDGIYKDLYTSQQKAQHELNAGGDIASEHDDKINDALDLSIINNHYHDLEPVTIKGRGVKS